MCERPSFSAHSDTQCHTHTAFPARRSLRSLSSGYAVLALIIARETRSLVCLWPVVARVPAELRVPMLPHFRSCSSSCSRIGPVHRVVRYTARMEGIAELHGHATVVAWWRRRAHE